MITFVFCCFVVFFVTVVEFLFCFVCLFVVVVVVVSIMLKNVCVRSAWRSSITSMNHYGQQINHRSCP